MNTAEGVKEKFKKEFSHLENKFYVLTLGVEEAKNANDSEYTGIVRPGVYVWWHPAHGVVKVGKHQINSRKRALEHVRDNTSSQDIQMADLANSPETKIVFFNIKEDRDLHWVLALEAFMEWNAEPKIKSARMG